MASLTFLVICSILVVVKAQEWSQFEQDALDSHNNYRVMHSTANLSLSRELCDYAQAWADYLAESDIFDHNPEELYGENLYARTGGEPDGSEPVDDWYSEIEKYDFNIPGPWPGTEHFTQVIWKSSLELGIAQATGASGWTYVVANYNPGGNSPDYEENVLPPVTRVH